MSATERLKQFTARINRLMDERDALNGDIRDVFQEVKSAGFSPPALRKVIAAMRMDPAKRDEIEAMVEIYRAAVGLAKPEALEMLAGGKTIRETNRATGVPLATLSRRSKTVAKAKTEQADPETGEITESEAGSPTRKDGGPRNADPAQAASDTPSPAGAVLPPKPSATDSGPVAAQSPRATPAGDTEHAGPMPAFLRRRPVEAVA